MHKTLILSILFAGCSDDAIGTTTFSTFVTTFTSNSSPTTVATAGNDDDPSSPVPTTGDTEGSTTGDSESSEGSSDSSEGSSEVTETGGVPNTPIPDIPSGCGHFVELLGRGTIAERYFVVDLSGCDRSDKFVLRYETLDGHPMWEAEVSRIDCGVYGGDASPAATTPGGVVLPIGLAVADGENFWRATLLVNDVPSDNLRVPPILQGQHWEGEPQAPITPVRRRDDWSLVPVEGHTPGCDLLPAG